MMKLLCAFLSLFLVFGVSGPPTIPAFAQQPPPAPDPLPLVDGLLRLRGLPGMSVAVVKDGEVIFAQAGGTRRQDKAIQIGLDDQFHLGLAGGVLTGTLAGRMIDEGTIDWTTTVIDVFPDWSGTIHDSFEQATAEQFLSNRSGVLTFLVADEPEMNVPQTVEGEGVEERRAFVKDLLSNEPRFEPGERYERSIVNEVVVAAMLEKLTGRSWRELVQQEVFTPLGIREFSFGLPAESQEDESQPWGHVSREARIILLPPMPDMEVVPPLLDPVMGVSMSMSDLARFAGAHLKGLRGEDGLLAAETVKRMHEVHEGLNAMGWAKIELFREPATGINGTVGFFYCFIVLWPEHNLAVAAAVNVGGQAGHAGCVDVVNWMYRLYHER